MTAELQHKRQKRRKKLTEKRSNEMAQQECRAVNQREKCTEGFLSDRGSYLCGTAQVIVVNLLDSLEVDDALQFALMLICEWEKQRCQPAKNRSLNKYFIALVLFENIIRRINSRS